MTFLNKQAYTAAMAFSAYAPATYNHCHFQVPVTV